jgi:hypothetical protein
LHLVGISLEASCRFTVLKFLACDLDCQTSWYDGTAYILANATLLEKVNQAITHFDQQTQDMLIDGNGQAAKIHRYFHEYSQIPASNNNLG